MRRDDGIMAVRVEKNGRRVSAKTFLWVVLVVVSLPSVYGFLHNPIRMFRIKPKNAPLSSPKVPLLHQNGDNYRVFFRREFDQVLDENNDRFTHVGELEQQYRFVGSSSNSKRRDLVSNKKNRRERQRKFSVKKRSNNKNKKPVTITPTLLVKPETASPAAPDAENKTTPQKCRIVTLSDGKIPTSREALPEGLFEEPHVLRKLDDIYHAMSHEETRRLDYMDKHNPFHPRDETISKEGEERKLVSVVRNSLEDAGFQLLTRRDLDLCDALNAGYLLRLSIVPDVKDLDEGITKEFYPEYFDKNGELQQKGFDELLFDGRVLVFWRGYSQEASRGRLLLPKLDYLQASLVQRTAAWLRRWLGSVEHSVSVKLTGSMRKVTAATIHGARAVADCVPNKPLSRALRTSLRATQIDAEHAASLSSRQDPFFKLSRYGGSKTRFVGSPNPTDSLDPFVICEENEECDFKESDCSMYDFLNHNNLRCPYDVKSVAAPEQLPPMQLLERVTLSTLVDPFTKEGRKGLFKSFFAKSELVEPTYEEVVVVWRQKEDDSERSKQPIWTPPRIVYELADMFDYDGLPEPQDSSKPKPKMPLQIRTFDEVPMANLPAVMPKTKLVFRPADAFVFDLISVVSFLLAVGSLKFNSPRMDILAIGAVSLWLFRLVIRYSNKLARYDLLVKKFLTSKISHRNSGALKYLVGEAGQQRAARAALVHSWLAQQKENELDRLAVLDQGMMDVNDIVKTKQVHVDIGAALNDLEDIGFVTCDGDKIEVAHDHESIASRIRSAWNNVLDGRISMSKLVGRRDH